jgi:hypothetical protein
VNVWPPAVRVPERAAPVFGDTVYATVPLPVPLVPDVRLIQDAFEDAVQVHPEGAVTAKLPDPPPAAIDWADGDKLKVHAAPGVISSLIAGVY